MKKNTKETANAVKDNEKAIENVENVNNNAAATPQAETAAEKRVEAVEDAETIEKATKTFKGVEGLSVETVSYQYTTQKDAKGNQKRYFLFSGSFNGVAFENRTSPQLKSICGLETIQGGAGVTRSRVTSETIEAIKVERVAKLAEIESKKAELSEIDQRLKAEIERETARQAEERKTTKTNNGKAKTLEDLKKRKAEAEALGCAEMAEAYAKAIEAIEKLEKVA